MAKLLYTPTDAGWTNQADMLAIHADQAWDTTLGSSAVRVCSIDSGMLTTHEDLSGRIVSSNFFGSTTTATDTNGHGTHVAGILAASINSGASNSIAGLAQVALLNAKVEGTLDDIARAFDWCVTNNADIITTSLGSYGAGTPALQTSVQAAWAAGVLVVAAAGNGGATGAFPAMYPEVIAVGALDSTNVNRHNRDAVEPGDQTYFGAKLEISAPSWNTWSACIASNTCYHVQDFGRTSFATPHVSGTAALMLSANSALSNGQLRTLLQCSATDIGAIGWDQDTGWGIVNAHQAVEYAVSGYCLNAPGLAFVAFSEDFTSTSSLSGWTTAAPLGTQLWARNSGGCGPSSPGSGGPNLRWADGSSCDYDYGNIVNYIVTPQIDLQRAHSARLSFQHTFEVEDYDYSYDRLSVYMATDGQSWQLMRRWDSRDVSGPWQTVTLEVPSSMLGAASLQVMFHAETGDNLANYYRGWRIDDVSVTGDSRCYDVTTDSFGYSCFGADFSFENIHGQSGTTIHTLSDDQVSGAVSIPFTFSFYGTGYSAIYISSNGFITFAAGSAHGCCSGQNIPSTGNPNNLIAGFWEDLNPGAGGYVDSATRGTVGERRFIVQFTKVPLYGTLSSDPKSTFQIVLYESTGDVGINFDHTWDDSGSSPATVGIENGGGTVGRKAAFGSGYRFDHTSLCFSTHPSCPEIASMAPLSEKFEGGAPAGWSMTGLWHLSGNRAKDTTSLYFGRTTSPDYGGGVSQQGYTTTKSVVLDSTPRISFQSWFESEDGFYDRRTLEVTTDNGATWTCIASSFVVANFCNGAAALDTTHSSWNKETITLANTYGGQTVRFRFGFDTVDQYVNDLEGWYVDNVAVT